MYHTRTLFTGSHFDCRRTNISLSLYQDLFLTDNPHSPGKVGHTTGVYVPYSFRTVVRYRGVTSNFGSRIKSVSSDQWYGTEWESRFFLLLVVSILYEVIGMIRNCNAKAAFLCCFVVSILWEVIKTVYHPRSLTAELVDWRAERTVGSVIQRSVKFSA